MKKKFNNIQSHAIDRKYYDKNPFEIENCELIEKLVESSDAVSSMTLFSRAASHKCLPWKSAFCSRLVPVPLFSGSSNFRAERRRGLAVVSKVSETETKTKISEAAEATESTEELQETLNSALKSVQEAWDKVDDKLAVGGLGFAALILLFASSGLINVSVMHFETFKLLFLHGLR
jgi:hypothetical protein